MRLGAGCGSKKWECIGEVVFFFSDDGSLATEPNEEV